jgi:hypothetical protein
METNISYRIYDTINRTYLNNEKPIVYNYKPLPCDPLILSDHKIILDLPNSDLLEFENSKHFRSFIFNLRDPDDIPYDFIKNMPNPNNPNNETDSTLSKLHLFYSYFEIYNKLYSYVTNTPYNSQHFRKYKKKLFDDTFKSVLQNYIKNCINFYNDNRNILYYDLCIFDIDDLRERFRIIFERKEVCFRSLISGNFSCLVVQDETNLSAITRLSSYAAILYLVISEKANQRVARKNLKDFIARVDLNQIYYLANKILCEVFLLTPKTFISYFYTYFCSSLPPETRNGMEIYIKPGYETMPQRDNFPNWFTEVADAIRIMQTFSKYIHDQLEIKSPDSFRTCLFSFFPRGPDREEKNENLQYFYEAFGLKMRDDEELATFMQHRVPVETFFMDEEEIILDENGEPYSPNVEQKIYNSPYILKNSFFIELLNFYHTLITEQAELASEAPWPLFTESYLELKIVFLKLQIFHILHSSPSIKEQIKSAITQINSTCDLFKYVNPKQKDTIFSLFSSVYKDETTSGKLPSILFTVIDKQKTTIHKLLDLLNFEYIVELKTQNNKEY